MGAYKYLEEIWRKKQSDVLRFLLRVRYQRMIWPFYLTNFHTFNYPPALGNIARVKRCRKLVVLLELIKLTSWVTKPSRYIYKSVIDNLLFTKMVYILGLRSVPSRCPKRWKEETKLQGDCIW